MRDTPKVAFQVLIILIVYEKRSLVNAGKSLTFFGRRFRLRCFFFRKFCYFQSIYSLGTSEESQKEGKKSRKSKQSFKGTFNGHLQLLSCFPKNVIVILQIFPYILRNFLEQTCKRFFLQKDILGTKSCYVSQSTL